MGHRYGSPWTLPAAGQPLKAQSILKALLQLLLAVAPLLMSGARLKSPYSLAAGLGSSTEGTWREPLGSVLGCRTSGLEGAWQSPHWTDGKIGGPEKYAIYWLDQNLQFSS